MEDLSSGERSSLTPKLYELPLVELGGSSNSNVQHEEEDYEDAYLNSFPPGYKFKPLDHELIGYLAKKVFNQPLPPNKIREVELYKYSPDHLTARYEPPEENAWYFFTPRDRKYKKGWRPKRAAGDGYWKTTTADKPIYSDTVPKLMIGSKKSLVYFSGKAPNGKKTDWIMYEYEVANAPKRTGGGEDMRLDDCVLCRIHRKLTDPSKAHAKETQEQQPELAAIDLQEQSSPRNQQSLGTIQTQKQQPEPATIDLQQSPPSWYPEDWLTQDNNDSVDDLW